MVFRADFYLCPTGDSVVALENLMMRINTRMRRIEKIIIFVRTDSAPEVSALL
jgi:hypothetical protein